MIQNTSPRISGTLRLSKHRHAVAADTPLEQTHPAVPPHEESLDLPSDRDEKVDMTGGIASPQVQQGARDLQRGIKDTSGSVESNVAYQKLK
jgi:hypothetical protein